MKSQSDIEHEIRIAISKICGTDRPYHTNGQTYIDSPNYHQSLDDARLFEMTLTASEIDIYERVLTEIVNIDSDNTSWSSKWCVWHASAMQRCKAFLIIKKSWNLAWGTDLPPEDNQSIDL